MAVADRRRNDGCVLMVERPAGEPPIWLGTLLVAGTLALIVATGLFLNAVFGG